MGLRELVEERVLGRLFWAAQSPWIWAVLEGPGLKKAVSKTWDLADGLLARGRGRGLVRRWEGEGDG